VLVLVMITGTLGCEDQAKHLSATGTVVFLDFEGGFYGIVDAQGGHWDPSNLPEDFKVDNLEVSFRAIVTDLNSTHMWGRTVDLISIERRQ
jgi:hypothetical protein